MLKTLSKFVFPRSSGQSRRERRLQHMVAARDQHNSQLTQRVRALEEELRKLQSTNRIQQVEIDELSAVVARNLERVKAETRELGASLPALGPYRITQPTQEIESDA